MPGRKGSFFCGSSSSEWFVGLWCVELLDVIIADNMGGGCSKGKNESTYDYNKTHFSFIRMIGKGGFGRVWKVTEKKSKEVYALKVIDKARVITKKSVQSVINQREILSQMLVGPSDFIVNMRAAFQDRENLYLLMDYLDSGDLRYYINRNYFFSEEQIKFLIRCLVEGLNHLHQRSIIHRDIKPQNIILDKGGYARITDLGIARYWKPQNSHQTSGTPGYMAPEVLLRQNHSFCADFYAVGVIAYELLIGKRPYNGRDRKSIREEMLGREAKIPKSYESKISKEGADFINRLLQRTSRKRLGYNGISEIINHPWLTLKYEQRISFLQRRLVSPIIPLQISFSQTLQEITEPDDVWRENILLLKRQDIQKMFENYDYSPSLDRSRSKKSEAETLATSHGARLIA